MAETIPPVLAFAGLLVVAMMIVAGASRAMWVALTVVFLAFGIFFRSGPPPGAANSSTLAADRGMSLALQSPPNDLVEAIVTPRSGATTSVARPVESSLPASIPGEMTTANNAAPAPSSSSNRTSKESLVEAIVTPK